MRMGRVVCVVLAAGVAGCGTTRMTDTPRSGSEMILISQAIDTTVARLDFSALSGKTVFLDVQYLDGAVDKGYLISSLRQHLLAHGALLQEKRDQSLYVVEPRSGAIGTDKNSLLIGVPALSLPPLIPGVPTTIPEIALIKNTDQRAIAKVAVFAYNRVTGRALWQSGTKEADSNLEDTWVFGAGPYSRGSIRPKAQIAGEEIPSLTLPFGGGKQSDPSLADQAEQADRYAAPSPSEAHEWTNADTPPRPQPVPFALLGLTGPAAAADRRIIRSGMSLPEDQAVQAPAPTVPVPPRAPTVPVSAPTPAPRLVQPPQYPLPKVN
jgi:hypothetical protein